MGCNFVKLSLHQKFTALLANRKLNGLDFRVGFPRDRTSCCLWTKILPCPAGAKIRGQTPLFRDVLGQNHILQRNQVTFPKETKKQIKDILKQEKEVLKQERTF
jgi:hypothetical protein